MKRCIKGSIAFLCLAFFVFSLYGETRAKDFDVELSINGTHITFTEETGKPFANETNRSYVPLRVVMETMGVNVDWDNDSKSAILTKDDTTVVVTIGSKIFTCNGEKVENDVEPLIIGGRTYLPIRKVAELFGAEVNWNKTNNTTEIECDWLKTIVQKVAEGIEDGIYKIYPYNAKVVWADVNLRSSEDFTSKKSDKENNIVTTIKGLDEPIEVLRAYKVGSTVVSCEVNYKGFEEPLWIIGAALDGTLDEDRCEIIVREGGTTEDFPEGKLPSAKNLPYSICSSDNTGVQRRYIDYAAKVDLLDGIIIKVASEFNLDPVLVKCIITDESHGDFTAGANGGNYLGLMQVGPRSNYTPEEQKILTSDPEAEIRRGCEMLAQKARTNYGPQYNNEPTCYNAAWKYNSRETYAMRVTALYTALTGKSKDTCIFTK